MRLAAAACALWFVLIQSIAAAHSMSPDALSPDHDEASCVYCHFSNRDVDATPTADSVAGSEGALYVPLVATDRSPDSLLLIDQFPRGPPVS